MSRVVRENLIHPAIVDFLIFGYGPWDDDLMAPFGPWDPYRHSSIRDSSFKDPTRP